MVWIRIFEFPSSIISSMKSSFLTSDDRLLWVGPLWIATRATGWHRYLFFSLWYRLHAHQFSAWSETFREPYSDSGRGEGWVLDPTVGVHVKDLEHSRCGVYLGKTVPSSMDERYLSVPSALEWPLPPSTTSWSGISWKKWPKIPPHPFTVEKLSNTKKKLKKKNQQVTPPGLRIVLLDSTCLGD